MGWFDEQLKMRQRRDDEQFQDTFLEIAGAVMGRRMSEALNDKRQLTRGAVEEILRFYHIPSREVPEAIRDMNEILEYLLRPAGIMRREVKLEGDWFRQATGAMLGTKKSDGSVVAFIPGKLHGYTWYDTATGERKRVSRRNADLFDQEAIAFYKPFPLHELGIKDLMKYMIETIPAGEIVIYCALLLLVTLIGLISPSLSAWLFAYVTPSGDVGALLAVAVFMISVSVSLVLFNAVKSIILSRINMRMSVNVEAAAMIRVLSLPTAFFRDYPAGELASRMQYITALCEAIIQGIMTSGLTGIFSLIYIAQLMHFAPALSLPAFLIILATFAVSVITVFLQMKVSRNIMEVSSKESGMTYAFLSGVQKIRLAGAEKRAFAKWGHLYAKEADAIYCPPLFLKVSSVITSAITLTGTIVLYALAVKTGVSLADYYAFNTSYGLVSGAFVTLSGMAATIAGIFPMLKMVEPILKAVPEVSEDKQVVTRLSGGVELNNVTFRYNENMPPVLDNLSLKIRPGQYVAIVGKTGCGKSTLMRVMLGFEKPQKGAVYYDGRDLNMLDLKSLRSKIGSVMQNGGLFTGDLYSNITISAPSLTLDEAWEAAEMAGIKEDIEQMPMKMFTMVSEGQGGISGGQRQRIMIARAIAPKPKILMFDEATSALDNITQKKVSDSLSRLKCTRIVIAHRLSTIKECDRIIVLDQGHIVEDGTYEELISAGGYFSELVERQRVDDCG